MNCIHKRRQQGLTLVEVMVAITISLILMAGLLQIFAGSKQTYNLGEALGRLQENGRFITETIAYDIRHTRYRGCLDPNEPSNTEIVSTLAGSPFDPAIDGYEGGTGWTNAVAGTDAITVRYAGPDGIALTEGMSSESSNIKLDRTAGLRKGMVLVIADCDSADVFTVTDVDDDNKTIAHGESMTDDEGNAIPVNSSSNLSKAYDTDARILVLRARTYYVRDTGRTAADGTAILALARSDNGAAGDLVEGVRSMQVLYGERVSKDNVRFVSADAAGLDMSKVVAVQIGILLQTVDAVGEIEDSATYTLAGTGVAAGGDKRIYRPFNITSWLRNQQIDD